MTVAEQWELDTHVGMVAPLGCLAATTRSSRYARRTLDFARCWRWWERVAKLREVNADEGYVPEPRESNGSDK